MQRLWKTGKRTYKGVIEYFKNGIMAGELRPEKLPPEREIAQMLEVSRNSVREALRIMNDGSDFLAWSSLNYITRISKALRRRWG